MMLFILYVIIDYFIIPLNDLAFAIALLAFWKGFHEIILPAISPLIFPALSLLLEIGQMIRNVNLLSI